MAVGFTVDDRGKAQAMMEHLRFAQDEEPTDPPGELKR